MRAPPLHPLKHSSPEQVRGRILFFNPIMQVDSGVVGDWSRHMESRGAGIQV